MSIFVSYYRMPKEEREKTVHHQASWDAFDKKLAEEWMKTINSAADDVRGFEGNIDEVFTKWGALIKERVDPRKFQMKMDWQILIHLSTGKKEIVQEHLEGEPLHNISFGGIKTVVETGYRKVCYFDQAMVAEITSALKTVDRERVIKRFDPVKMTGFEIYSLPDERECEGIFEGLDKLTEYFQTAASTHDEVITFVS